MKTGAPLSKSVLLLIIFVLLFGVAPLSSYAQKRGKEQVRLAPNDAMAQYDLGYFYNAMGRHGEAFAPLVKATGLDPNFAEAYYGIGYAYLRGADFEKSITNNMPTARSAKRC